MLHVLLLVPTSWAYLEATSFAASATEHWIQAGCFGAQSDEWPVSIIFGGWLPAYLYCRPTTTSIVQRRHVWGSKNSHNSMADRSFTVAGAHLWNSLPLHLRDSEHLTYFPRVPPPVIEDALVLLRTVAHSDCFCALYKSAFTLHYVTLQNIISFCHNPHVWQTDRQRGRNAYVTAGACI